jgi:cell division protein FtsB
MDKAIKDLSCDRDSLEGFAREEFHFAAPGDDVYIDENAR